MLLVLILLIISILLLLLILLLRLLLVLLVLLLRLLLVLTLLLLVLLLRLLRLLLRFLLLFFQLFNRFFQIFDIFPVIQQLLLLSGGQLFHLLPLLPLLRRHRSGRFDAQGFYIQLFRLVQLPGGFRQRFQRTIQIFALQLLGDGLQNPTGLAVFRHRQIVERVLANHRLTVGGVDGILIQFYRIFGTVLLQLQRLVVSFDRRSRQQFAGRQFRGSFRLRRTGQCRFRRRGRRRNPRQNSQQQPYRHSGRMIFVRTFGKKEIEEKQHKRRQQEIVEPLDRQSPFAAADRIRRQFPDRAQQCLFAIVGHGAADVDAAGFQGDLFQQRFIELAFDQFAGTVAFEYGRAATGLRHQRRHVRIAEANDEKRNVLLLQFGQRPAGIAGQLVAVGNQNDGAVIALRRIEGRDGGIQRLFQIGAADRNAVRRQFVDILFKTGFVRSQRTLQKRRTGKSDQTETVAAGFLNQIIDQHPGVRQPGGSDIGGQHALGNVENEQQVAPFAFIGNQALSPPRPGDGDAEQRDDRQQQDETPSPLEFRQMNGRRRFGPVAGYHFQRRPPSGIGMKINDDHRRQHKRQNPEYIAVDKIHSRFSPAFESAVFHRPFHPADAKKTLPEKNR